MLCEMCGEETDAPVRAKIEGSVLLVCSDCSRFGTVLTPPPPAAAVASSRGRPPAIPSGLALRARRMSERDLYQELPEMELAEDWPHRIRIARERLQWTPEELGKRLNEKKSVVLKLEAGHFRPPDATIRKIESLLHIRLRADPTAATETA